MHIVCEQKKQQKLDKIVRMCITKKISERKKRMKGKKN